MRASRHASFAFLPLLLLVVAGCGGGNKSTDPVPEELPAGTPQADSPPHLVQRFEATWEAQALNQYALLLTEDFRFEFSNAADPGLVVTYGDHWKKADEVAAITQLFDGFTPLGGTYIPGASTIRITLPPLSFDPDPDHPDSTTHYREVSLGTFAMIVDVAPAGGQVDTTRYQIGNGNRQDVYLVRGDAAVLAAGAARDSTRWYIRRWEDKTPGILLGKTPVINPGSFTTLGRIKALYR